MLVNTGPAYTLSVTHSPVLNSDSFNVNGQTVGSVSTIIT